VAAFELDYFVVAALVLRLGFVALVALGQLVTTSSTSLGIS
jgi:hypothetical protein